MDADENVLVLTDDEGNDVPFEILEDLTLEDTHYVLLAAMDEDEDDGILIFRVEADAEGNESFLPEEDGHMLQRVLDTYIVDDEGNSYAEEDFVPAE